MRIKRKIALAIKRRKSIEKRIKILEKKVKFIEKCLKKMNLKKS